MILLFLQIHFSNSQFEPNRADCKKLLRSDAFPDLLQKNVTTDPVNNARKRNIDDEEQGPSKRREYDHDYIAESMYNNKYKIFFY